VSSSLRKRTKASRGLLILYQMGDKTLQELLDFPNAETNSPEVANEKQRRLFGQTAKEPAAETISDARRNNIRCSSSSQGGQSSFDRSHQTGIGKATAKRYVDFDIPLERKIGEIVNGKVTSQRWDRIIYHSGNQKQL
jgi:hypothetical protein